ncbi:TorF family putative porin [Novosphingobium sp. FSW06-99]|uniref:TorF family putative porin n=1 Tax=Novosphingobium sp. FSW06-99 TaxID=1739113 RepID=UPI0009EB31B1|nr:TorF family putative porin [Novosphingobium sp. FSW06-99]
MLARAGACGHDAGVILSKYLPVLHPAVWLIACAALAPVSAHAGDIVAQPSPFSLSGSAEALSQYRFRGISRSDGQPAVQGDLSVTHTSGIYAGVTLASESPGPAVDLGHGELDVYAGYDHALGASGWMLDVGLRGYFYADRAHADLVELSAALDHQIGPIDVRAGVAWAPPQGALGRTAPGNGLRDNLYAYAQARADIPGTPFNIHAHAGHTAGGLDYTGSYWDYRVGLGASRKAVGLDLSLVGTNVSHAAALAAPQGPAADPEATWRAARRAGVITLSYQF